MSRFSTRLVQGCWFDSNWGYHKKKGDYMPKIKGIKYKKKVINIIPSKKKSNPYNNSSYRKKGSWITK